MPFQFIFVGPSSDNRGTAIRLNMITKDGSPVPEDADVLLESYYHTGSERTVMFQGKYGEFSVIADQEAPDAAVSLQKRAEIGEQYVIRLSVSVASGSPARPGVRRLLLRVGVRQALVERVSISDAGSPAS